MAMTGIKGKRGTHERVRMYPGIMGFRPDGKARRIEEAKARQAEYDKLTTMQKIEQLDRMFGKNCGAKKQRTKLEKRLDDERAAKKTVAAEAKPTEPKQHLKAKERRAKENKK